MSIFDKFRPLAKVRDGLMSTGVQPFGVVTEKILSPTKGLVNGREVILAGTNNYLGLTFEPECVETAVDALRNEGTGTTGSRMANGTYAGHVALEQELVDFFKARDAIVFSTGYQATMGMVATLLGPGDVVLMDADSHASIYDGCRMSGADMVRFRHNDVADLERRMQRLGERAADALIVVEGIYSMLGDRAPLREIAALKRRYGGLLLVDEAHSMGVLGANGRGLAEEVGVEEDVDFVVGTFSKSLGSVGGYCVSRRPELELIRYATRSYIFTASPTPSVIASTRCALRHLRTRPELRERLWANAERLYKGLQDLGFQVGPQASPVVAAYMEGGESALMCWHRLMGNDVYVNLVLPPASPKNTSLLRCSISAAHTPQQIGHILEAYEALPCRIGNEPIEEEVGLSSLRKV